MSSKTFEPLLACETPEDLTEFERKGHYPVYGSYKLDGIRGTVLHDQIVSRRLKKLPSAYAERFARPELLGLDGEVLAARRTPGRTLMQDSYSAVMTHGSMEPLHFYVFDVAPIPLLPSWSYDHRLDLLRRMVEDYCQDLPEIEVLEQRLLCNLDEVLMMEQEALDLGHEGLIIRRPDAPYKYGRSTLRQGYLMKVARTLTAEAIIVDFEEQMENTNEAVLDERGYTKRSKHQEGMIGKDTLGAFVVRDIKTGIVFKIGTGEGLDDDLRKHIWENRGAYCQEILKYKYKPYGTNGKPRHPVWLGWRSPNDM